MVSAHCMPLPVGIKCIRGCELCHTSPDNDTAIHKNLHFTLASAFHIMNGRKMQKSNFLPQLFLVVDIASSSSTSSRTDWVESEKEEWSWINCVRLDSIYHERVPMQPEARPESGCGILCNSSVDMEVGKKSGSRINFNPQKPSSKL